MTLIKVLYINIHIYFKFEDIFDKVVFLRLHLTPSPLRLTDFLLAAATPNRICDSWGL